MPPDSTPQPPLDPTHGPDRVRELRSRWEAEPRSRVFVQLAEEYRRLGQVEEAVEVLEEGLERQPAVAPARVALGRCRLELGDAEGAIEPLESVVAEDPTQLVANKALVEAYLAAGRGEEARERLDHYRLLTDDPEAEVLEARVARLTGGGAEETAADAQAQASPGGASAPDEGAAEAVPPPVGAPSEARREAPEPVSAPAWTRAAPFAANGADGEEPFGDLGGEESLHRYLEGLVGGGLFAWSGGAVPGAAAGEAPRSAEPELAREAEASVDESVPEAGSGTPPPPPAPEPAEPGEPSSPARPAPAPRGAEPRPTITLGRLYLQQGHPEEAERIFRQVLARDPGHRGAREALAGLGASLAPEAGEVLSPAPVSGFEPAPIAAEPVATEPPLAVEEARASASTEPTAPLAAASFLPPAEELPGGLTERKITLLERYLARLRAAEDGPGTGSGASRA